MRVTSQIPPTSPQLAFVGEAPGEEEAFRGIPFVGASGRFFHHALKSLNINPSECYIGNVFSERPPQNDVSHFFHKKALYKKLHPKDPSPYCLYSSRGFLSPDYTHDLSRLRDELHNTKPNLAVALGATALWALTGQSKIGAYRGTILPSTLVPGLKVLPTYHPAYILRNYQDRSIFNADLLKAKIESQSPEIHIPTRTIYVPETLSDLYTFEKEHMASPPRIAIDVETSMTHGILLCLSIAPSPQHALVVPITKRTTYSYWPTKDLPKVLAWLNHIFSLPSIKIGQNFLFDISWLEKYNLFVREPLHDTMLLHHALQPELPKDLGTLGSIYCNCPAWKQMSPWKKKELAKVEE